MKVSVYDDYMLLQDVNGYETLREIVAIGGDVSEQFKIGDIVFVNPEDVVCHQFFNNKQYAIVTESAILGKVYKDA